MTLDEWLRLEGVSEEAFGAKIGVSQQTVHRYRTGKSIPDRDIMLDVARVTAGKVQANDFYASAQPTKRTKKRAAKKRAA